MQWFRAQYWYNGWPKNGIIHRIYRLSMVAEKIEIGSQILRNLIYVSCRALPNIKEQYSTCAARIGHHHVGCSANDLFVLCWTCRCIDGVPANQQKLNAYWQALLGWSGGGRASSKTSGDIWIQVCTHLTFLHVLLIVCCGNKTTISYIKVSIMPFVLSTPHDVFKQFCVSVTVLILLDHDHGLPNTNSPSCHKFEEALVLHL